MKSNIISLHLDSEFPPYPIPNIILSYIYKIRLIFENKIIGCRELYIPFLKQYKPITFITKEFNIYSKKLYEILKLNTNFLKSSNLACIGVLTRPEPLIKI